MQNKTNFKIVCYLSIFLTTFFFLINNINILSTLESRNSRLFNELTRQEDNLNRISMAQEVDLTEEIREKEASGRLEFVSQSSLKSITEILPKSLDTSP